MTEYAQTSQGDRVGFDRSGSGPGVVFIAGAGQQRATDPVTASTATLAADLGVTTVVYDRLGRGESPASGPITMERELAAIAAMIDAAGGSAVLCGHSSGGALALAATAAGLPVTGAVLWEAPIAGDPDETIAWADEFVRLLDAGELEAAQLHYMRDMPPEWLEQARSSPMWPAMVAQAPSMRADADAMRWAAQRPLGERFTASTVPVLAVIGTATLDVMERSAEVVRAQITHATVERLAGQNHTWDPQAMAARLVEFTRAVSS